MASKLKRETIAQRGAGQPALAGLPLALTVKQAAELANVSTDALYDAIARGDCPWPVLRMGRVIRLPRAAVLASLGLDGEEV